MEASREGGTVPLVDGIVKPAHEGRRERFICNQHEIHVRASDQFPCASFRAGEHSGHVLRQCVPAMMKQTSVLNGNFDFKAISHGRNDAVCRLRIFALLTSSMCRRILFCFLSRGQRIAGKADDGIGEKLPGISGRKASRSIHSLIKSQVPRSDSATKRLLEILQVRQRRRPSASVFSRISEPVRGPFFLMSSMRVASMLFT